MKLATAGPRENGFVFVGGFPQQAFSKTKPSEGLQVFSLVQVVVHSGPVSQKSYLRRNPKMLHFLDRHRWATPNNQ